MFLWKALDQHNHRLQSEDSICSGRLLITDTLDFVWCALWVHIFLYGTQAFTYPEYFTCNDITHYNGPTQTRFFEGCDIDSVIVEAHHFESVHSICAMNSQSQCGFYYKSLKPIGFGLFFILEHAQFLVQFEKVGNNRTSFVNRK